MLAENTLKSADASANSVEKLQSSEAQAQSRAELNPYLAILSKRLRTLRKRLVSLPETLLEYSYVFFRPKLKSTKRTFLRAKLRSLTKISA
jgi:hypothetical protein